MRRRILFSLEIMPSLRSGTRRVGIFDVLLWYSSRPKMKPQNHQFHIPNPTKMEEEGTRREILLDGTEAIDRSAIESVHAVLGEIEVNRELGLERLVLGHRSESLGDVMTAVLTENKSLHNDYRPKNRRRLIPCPWTARGIS